MILDSRDIELLRLAGRYHWLPDEGIGKFGFGGALENEIDILSAAGLIKIARNKTYIRLSPQGYKILQMNGYDYGPSSSRPYNSVSSLRRRLEVSELMLTCLRAGIDTLRDDIDTLAGQPTFYPAFDLRDGETNLMNAASCAGFGHWGNKGYMLQYLSPQSNGMYLTNELGHLHNLSSLFSSKLNAPLAMIFAGASYRLIHGQLCGKSPSKRHGKGGYVDFWSVYRKSDIPIHLLSCDETGARQLALMRQPDYNARIARAAFGDRWTPHDDMFPEADGVVDGVHPLIIAADMNIRRVGRVIADAKRFGAKEVWLTAFRSQMEALLMDLFPRDGMTIHLLIESPLLEAAFGKDFSLHFIGQKDSVPEGGAGDA